MSIIQISSGKNARRKPRFPARLDSRHLLGRPAACWLMNEDGGQSIYDVSGNANTGTLNGGASWATSERGNAVQFFGDTSGNQAVSVPNSNWLNPSSVSISVWFKANPQQNTTRNAIVGKAYKQINNQVYQYLLRLNFSALLFQLSTSTGGVLGFCLDNSKNYTDGKWHHAVAAYSNPLDTIFLFSDGVLVASTSGLSSKMPTDGLQPLFIGGFGQTVALGSSLTGLISDVRIYPTVLSQTQIWRLYQRPYEMILSPHTSRGLIFGYLKPAYAKNIGINLHFNT